MQQNNHSIPLLSIVIASRNRIPYAISAIQSILEISDPRLELVVQDNSDSRDLESYVRENIKDTRFRYRYTPPPIFINRQF
jgi:glycosyltransferase involved in cell wall biosynthesis